MPELLCFKKYIYGYFNTFIYAGGILYTFQGTDGVILFMQPRVQNTVETTKKKRKFPTAKLNIKRNLVPTLTISSLLHT